MDLNSDSIKLRKKINECESQSDKEWWEQIYKLAVQERKEREEYNGESKN